MRHIMIGMVLLFMAAGQPAFGQGALVTIHPEDVARSARILCPRLHPESFALQGGCRRNYESGAASINEIAMRHAGRPAMQRALRRCLADYTINAITDFAIAGGCARNQERGWQEMNR